MIYNFKIFEDYLYMKGFGYNWDVYPIGTKVVYIGKKGMGLKRGQEYEIEEIVSTRHKSLREYKLKNIDGIYKSSDFISLFEYDAKKYNL